MSLHPRRVAIRETPLERARRALEEVGNIVGGPTASYSPAVELNELKRRMVKVAHEVALGLKESR